MNAIGWGGLASFLAGAMTAVGALPVLLGGTISRRLHDTLLSFAAGKMLSASFFSLIMPGIEHGAAIYGAGSWRCRLSPPELSSASTSLQ